MADFVARYLLCIRDNDTLQQTGPYHTTNDLLRTADALIAGLEGEEYILIGLFVSANGGVVSEVLNGTDVARPLYPADGHR